MIGWYNGIDSEWQISLLFLVFFFAITVSMKTTSALLSVESKKERLAFIVFGLVPSMNSQSSHAAKKPLVRIIGNLFMAGLAFFVSEYALSRISDYLVPVSKVHFLKAGTLKSLD